MNKVKPLASWIVAESKEVSNKTASGLYIPDSAKERSKLATVNAVGNSVNTVQVGDDILYKEYSTTEVKLEGKEYILVKEEDVLATVS